MPFFLLFFLLLFSPNIGSAQTISFSSPEQSFVTANAYCHFLNAAATTDLQHFYDEKMSSDPETASIVRLGTAGNFHYEVIADRENFPSCYGNHLTSINYHELSSTADNENNDPYLTSNRINIPIDRSSLSIVTLAIITPTRSAPSHEWSKFDTLSIIFFAAAGMLYGPSCKAITLEANIAPSQCDRSSCNEGIKTASLDSRRAIIPPQEKKCACCEKCGAAVPLRESIDTKNLRQDDQDESAWRKFLKLFFSETKPLFEEKPPSYGTFSENYRSP